MRLKFHSNLRFPFSSFFFLDRYRFFLNITFLVESVFSFFFSPFFLDAFLVESVFSCFHTFLFSFINSQPRIKITLKAFYASVGRLFQTCISVLGIPRPRGLEGRLQWNTSTAGKTGLNWRAIIWEPGLFNMNIWKNTPVISRGYSGQRSRTVAIKYPWLTSRTVPDVSWPWFSNI